MIMIMLLRSIVISKHCMTFRFVYRSISMNRFLDLCMDIHEILMMQIIIKRIVISMDSNASIDINGIQANLNT